jgi:hypothetical protein
MKTNKEHIRSLFPYFYDFSPRTNNDRILHIMNNEYRRLRNSLEQIRCGYYYRNAKPLQSIQLEHTPLTEEDSNSLRYITTNEDEYTALFRSEHDGTIGSAQTEVTGTISESSEHINIEHYGNYYRLYVYANDIKSISITGDGYTSLFTFDYLEHQSYFTKTIGLTSNQYKVTVVTYDEYTYESSTGEYNTDLDKMALFLGVQRREFLDKIIMIQPGETVHFKDTVINGEYIHDRRITNRSDHIMIMK